MRFAAVCACLGAVYLAVQAQAAPPMALGINLSRVSEIDPAIPFVDAFKESQPWVIRTIWVPPGTAISGASAIGPDGWVQSLATNQEASACVFTNDKGHYPGGAYTLLYDGQGALSVSGHGAITNSSPGQATVVVSPQPGSDSDYGFCVNETATDPANPIRNIRMILPGYLSTYQTQPFYPPYLSLLAPFSTIRFIGWQQPNGSPIVNWADRRPQSYPTQALSVSTATAPVTQTGVALEWQIALANALGEDPWFNIPTKASDDYITQMATLVHATLNPKLHPHIEFSNEIWNTGFPDAAYAVAQGTAMNLDPGAPPATTRAGLFWYATRAARMFTIWNQVWGADAGRVVNVVAGEQNNPTEVDTILGYNNLASLTNVVAVGAYAVPYRFANMPLPEQSLVSKLNYQQVQAQMLASIGPMVAQITANKAIADKYGLPLAVYEGDFALGDAILPSSSPYRWPIFNLMYTATWKPGAETAYTSLVSRLAATGVTLFNHFDDIEVPSLWGCFGLITDMTQLPQQSPKYQALTSYLKTAP